MSVTTQESLAPANKDDFSSQSKSIVETKKTEPVKVEAVRPREELSKQNPVPLVTTEPKETLTPKIIKHDEVLAKPTLIKPQHEIAPQLDREDPRDLLTKAIESNPCQLCSKVRKLGRCVCITSFAGAPVMAMEEEDKTAEIEEEEYEASIVEEERVRTQAVAPREVVLQGLNQLRPDRYEQRTLHPAIVLLMGELIAKGLLQVKKNPADGVIEFAYQYNAQEEENDRLKFEILTQAILHELRLFREQHNIAEHCHMLGYDLNGQMNSLRISFVNPMHYDRFTLIIAPQNREQQDKRNMMSQRQVDMLLNPLATRLVMSGNNNAQQAEEEKEQEYHSPFRPPHPADRFRRLRPLGF
jgi:hypothetical protein